MRNVLIAFGAVVGTGLFLHCSPFPDACYGAECDALYGEGGLDVAQPPVGCDVTADPKDSPACLDDGYAIFIDSVNGNDAADGTKTTPVKTINHGLALLDNKPRIYICGDGTSIEHIELTRGISLYGGYDCASWEYNGKKATVKSDGPNPALKLTRIPDAVTVSDLRFEAQPENTEAPSSIAVFAVNSTVIFKRTELVAHAGAEGSPGNPGRTDTPTVTSVGDKDAHLTTPGVGVACTCTIGESTAGGDGGTTGSNGSPGTPKLDENPKGQSTPHTGEGGGGGSSCIYPGGLGLPGADAPPGSNGNAIAIRGTLTPAGWSPSDGKPGKDGNPGQGGGGGGGNDGAGGGGGCGGCGGTGGGEGQAGGSSIALLSYQSTVHFISCSLLTDRAGGGGRGGSGGGGIAGGGGGLGGAGAPNNGCSGGNGGQGGAGGAGSGGAGGISAGILYSGTAPDFDADTTIQPGTPGALGGAGTAGEPSSAAGNPGLEGLSGKMVSADDWTVTP